MKAIFSLLLICTPLLFFGQSKQVLSENGELINIEKVLQKYIQFPSLSESEKEAGTYLKSICKNNGLYISDFGTDNGQYNFAASILPLSSGKPNIILLSHIDVVPESDTNLRKAYSGEIEDDVIYGRGAIDNKGAGIMQLYGMLKFKDVNEVDDLPYNITFLAVSCEETQCQGGIQYVLDNHFEELNAVAVVGEGPSELTGLIEGEFDHPVFGISLITKRPLWLELIFTSKTNGHGSITPTNYANKEMVEALHRLTKKKPKVIYNDMNVAFLKDVGSFHNGPKKAALRNPKLFRPAIVPHLRKFPELLSLFTNTITLTNLITNGGAVNKLSSQAIAQLDCRLLPETNETEFLHMIRSRLKNEEIEIRVLERAPKVAPSPSNSIYHESLVKAITSYYPKAKTMDMLMPNTNDLFAFRQRNIPSYGAIPVYFDKEEVRSVHGKNEHLHLKSLHDGSEVFLRFIQILMGVPSTGTTN
ncbi:M20/M25/M40 family metallo-hydrolase [Lutimonas sp.]|uniref:M20/M25/M40 family metallo-hydrolase n=1 Tax=Lutimonas sp. TaxID=1872403 RepID=UPI003D9AED90